MDEFRTIKKEYVSEYRQHSLYHKSQIEYFTRVRDIALKHLIGAEEIRKPKRKSNMQSMVAVHNFEETKRQSTLERDFESF